MDPQVQDSFIPKTSLVESPRGAGMGLLMLVSLFLFIFSVVAAGAAFGYERYLESSIAEKDATLKKAEGAFDSGTIRDLLRLDARLTEGRELLRSHTAPSAIFELLERETLERVQFVSLDYVLNTDGSASLSLEGRASSFSTLALQSDRLSQSKVLRDVIFSGITVSEQGGVKFAIKATVDPGLLRYTNKQISSGQQTTEPQQQPAVSPPPENQVQTAPQASTSSSQTL